MKWQPTETMPKSGEFLVFVWEGTWRNPEERFRIFHATGFPSGASFARSYRTEEGEAYRVAGWMPLPEWEEA